MKIALDPYMHRHLSLPDVARLAADLGYEYIELSPRSDFFEWFRQPRVDDDRIREFKQALRETGVQLASLLPLYRWASPNEDERRAAVRYWKRAIEVAAEMECQTMNSEFTRGPSPQISNFCAGPSTAEQSEAAFWASMDELLPVFEREGIMLHLEPHPDDFIEDGNAAVDMIRAIGSPNVKYLYCAPHTFHMGNDMAGMIRYAAPVLAHVHVADTLNHKASSGLRYIINPPGSTARVHQHLNIGEGEIDWDLFFKTLREVGFDGILTACVFAWEDRAVESSRLMRERIQHYLDKYPPATAQTAALPQQTASGAP
ncbi:MAG TPA: protein iolH [Chloroflexi bacterium]|nr:protein iolH [Chloroflexota bacterium]